MSAATQSIQYVQRGFPLFPVLYVVLIVLKFLGILHWGWLATLTFIIWAPILVGLGVFVVLFLLFLIFAFFAAIFS